MGALNKEIIELNEKLLLFKRKDPNLTEQVN